MVLHLICLCRDGKLRWHWAGMAREFHRSTVGQPAAQNQLVKRAGHGFALFAGALLAAAPAAHAGSHTWSGAVNGLWSVAGNWSAGGAPAGGEAPLNLTFPAGAMLLNSTNDVAGLQLDSLKIGRAHV